MENSELGLEKLVSLGDRNKERGNYDQSLHYYNQAIRLNPDNIDINNKLAEAYVLKAEKEKRKTPTYYQLAMECYRKILTITPENEQIHNKLILLGKKISILDELVIEYKEKLSKEKNNSIISLYEDCLKNISTLILFDIEDTILRKRNIYRPNFLVRITFDFILLPSSLSLIAISVSVKGFQTMFFDALMLFLFYCGYRLVLLYINK